MGWTQCCEINLWEALQKPLAGELDAQLGVSIASKKLPLLSNYYLPLSSRIEDSSSASSAATLRDSGFFIVKRKWNRQHQQPRWLRTEQPQH